MDRKVCKGSGVPSLGNFCWGLSGSDKKENAEPGSACIGTLKHVANIYFAAGGSFFSEIMVCPSQPLPTCLTIRIAMLGCPAGHSLGAAVAMLCALRLHALHQHPGGRANVRCYTFGAPAIGNQALAGWVSSSAFHRDFHNFILPGKSWSQTSANQQGLEYLAYSNQDPCQCCSQRSRLERFFVMLWHTQSVLALASSLHALAAGCTLYQ